MKGPASTIWVTMGLFQRPDFCAWSRAISATLRCSGEVTKIADRYCDPTSFPCRSRVVGSCIRKNHFSSSSS